MFTLKHMFRSLIKRLQYTSIMPSQKHLINLDKYKPLGIVSRSIISKKLEPTFTSIVNQEQFLNGTSATYIEEMYNIWLSDPKSVNASWNVFFKNCTAGATPGMAYQAPPVQYFPGTDNVVHVQKESNTEENRASSNATVEVKFKEHEKRSDDTFIVQSIVGEFRAHGHYFSKLDPLYLSNAETVKKKGAAQLLDRSVIPLGDNDLDRMLKLPPTTKIGDKNSSLPLKEIVSRLENVYCRSVGAEFTYIDSAEQRDWISERMETPVTMDQKEKQRVFTRLMKATLFESFLGRKWSSEKRFGLEGCEALIPAMNEIVDKSSAYGVNTCFIGMPHRGRLNVLANVCQKPLSSIFTHFHGLKGEDGTSGDVKYHLGAYTKQINEQTTKQINLVLVSNPSHLEAVGPVVQGKTRAEQFFRGDTGGKESMAILLHGDSAFSGQGVVYETFQLSNLPDYTTHGTVHIVVNNQIGFTANPDVSRSSPYCTDVAHVIKAPVFHVNGDDPEAVVRVCGIAVDWRNTFKKDVVVDIVCYRRNGHNEIDEPMFTQPAMYKVIKSTKPVYQKYTESLVEENVISKDDVKALQDDFERICEEAYVESQKQSEIKYADWLDSPWPGFFENSQVSGVPKTGVDEDTLKHIGDAYSSLPESLGKFVVHKGIDRIFKGRQQMIKNRTVDWALAEAMAFGSLLKDGVHVRLSGQDVERGTFSHRHHVLHDQETGNSTYRPLNNLYPEQAQYTVSNSFLSEFAVLGFETGFSMANPKALICWEAQFGDFNNNAQCIIDQFISSGQAKWVRQSGLVMLLPHGYEGMGPEHSSARLERFLQMTSDDPDVVPEQNERFAIGQLQDTNWIVVNCSTPANYFHVLRRQVALPFRKPLIVMTPKSLLRHPEAKSGFDEMTENAKFLRVIPEKGIAADNVEGVKRLIFCSGKVYYDLVQEREERKLADTVAICRVEQICPFPFDLVKNECDKYINADVVWTQEEPKNQGPWYYVQVRMKTVLNDAKSLSYAGRPVAASPATGNKVKHVAEMKSLLHQSFAI